MNRLLVRLLALVMVVVEPLSFALVASSGSVTLIGYGLPALLLLALRVAVTGFGIVTGRALWHDAPAAAGAARLWLVLSSVATTLTFVTPYFPSNRLPDTKWLTLAAILTVNALFFLVLSRRRVSTVS